MGLVRASVFSCAVLLATACGKGSGAEDFVDQSTEDGGSAPPPSPQACAPGETAPCACVDGRAGSKTCSATGTYEGCSCTATPPPPDAAAAVCGDRVCVSGETCKACPSDCGDCPKCNLAPSCSNGLALPSQPAMIAFDDLAKPMPPATTDAGAPIVSTCEDAQLRLRIARLEVGHQAKEVWLPTGTISGPPQSYYCVVQASDGVVVSSTPDAGANGTVEVALTKPTAQIPDYQGADFAPTDSIFWGQLGPRLTHNNLTITYSCFQQKDSGAASWTNVLNAAAGAAGSLASSGPYGWAFGLGSIGLQVVAAAVGAAQNQGDWHMFDVTQTIDRSRLVDLTNGRRWSFTQSGGESAFHYPWKLSVVVESWGCADALPQPAH
jgi:hypothetical protein